MYIDRFSRVQPVGQMPTAREFVDTGLALERTIDDIIGRTILPGRLIEDVELTPFVDNEIQHKLGRKLRGYAVARREFVPSSFRAYRNTSTQTVATGVSTTLIFNTEDHDEASAYSTTTGIYTCPVQGLYRFETSWVTATAAVDQRAYITRIQRNGANEMVLHLQSSGTATVPRAGASMPAVRCAASDTVLIEVNQDSGGNVVVSTGATATWFAGGIVDEGITDRQAVNTTPEKTLVLRCSYTQTVSLWVY